MEDKYFELFKLNYEKLFKSLRIIYDTLDTYNSMAYSQKKILKEADLIVQAILIKSLINSNEVTLEKLQLLNKLSKYDSLLKPLKIHKAKELDSSLMEKINKTIVDSLVEDPTFIKMCKYFDNMVAKIEGNKDKNSASIIIKCFKSMLALIRNIDDASINDQDYDHDIEYILKKFEK